MLGYSSKETSWQVMQQYSDTADSGKPHIVIVIYCVKRSMNKSVAVHRSLKNPLLVWDCHQRAQMNSLIQGSATYGPRAGCGPPGQNDPARSPSTKLY